MMNYNLVSFVLISKNRKLVLESLTACPKNSVDIADETGIPRRSVTKAVKDLKDLELVAGSRKEYKITDEGNVILNILKK